MTGTLIAMCHRFVYQGRVVEARGWTSGIQGWFTTQTGWTNNNNKFKIVTCFSLSITWFDCFLLIGRV